LAVPGMPCATVGIDNAPDRVLRNDVMGTGPGALVAQPRHDTFRVLPGRATPPVASNPGNLPVPRILVRGSVFGNVFVGSSHNETPFGHRKSPHSNARGLTKMCGG